MQNGRRGTGWHVAGWRELLFLSTIRQNRIQLKKLQYSLTVKMAYTCVTMENGISLIAKKKSKITRLSFQYSHSVHKICGLRAQLGKHQAYIQAKFGFAN